MASTSIFLGLLVAVSSVSAENFWPLGRDLTYDYSADVRVGSIEPAHYASQYTIHGKLRVQAHDEEAVIKLDDVRYQLYNGEVSHHQHEHSSPLPAPEETSTLTSPFRIQYKDGKVKKLFTEVSDPVWVLNIKKGLASLLQLDLTQRMRMDVPSAFWGEENSIFGTCDVSYSFIGSGDYHTITKTVNPEGCKGYPYETWGNEETYGCGQEEKESPTSSHYKRVYRIKVGGDAPVITNVNSEYTTALTPFRSRGVAGYLLVNQTATLASNVPAGQRLVLNQEREVQELTYTTIGQDAILGSGLDFTQGRYSVDTDSLIPKAVALLEDILKYQEESHVDGDLPNLQKSSLVFLLIKPILSRLGVDGLSALYTQLSQGSTDRDVMKRDLFVKLLPEVGTQSAVITVRNLIRKHKVKTWLAQELLQAVPFNVHNPTEKLLLELEDVLDLNEEYTEEIRHAALLSFANLVYKTAKTNPNAEFVNKYATIYYNRGIEAKNDFATQIVYLQGLSNIRVGKAAQYLEALIVEGSNLPRHVRHLALLGSAPNVYNNYNKAYRLYWPILVNNQLHLQLRAAALKILLTSATKVEHFTTIHSYMSGQRNNIHLYKTYYKFLQAKTTTSDLCFGQTASHARRILRFTQPPLYDNLGTGYEVIDFTDKDYGFGKALHLDALADQATGYPSVLLATLEETSHGLVQSPYAVYLKLEGLEQLLWGKSEQYSAKPTKAPAKIGMLKLSRRHNQLSADDLIRKVSSAKGKLQKPIHIELIVTKQHQTIYSLFLNNSRLDSVLEYDIPQRLKELKKVLQNLNSNIVNTDYSKTLHLPTDLGVPLVIQGINPNIISMTGRVGIVDNSLQFDATYRLWSNTFSSLAILNPVAGSWHGLQKIITHNSQLPIRVGLKRDEEGFKLLLGSATAQDSATIGSRSFQQLLTFALEEDGKNNLLGASCASCESLTPVTRGENNLKEVVLLHSQVPGTGLVADVRVFDCEQDVSITSLRNTALRFLDQATMNAHGSQYLRILLGLQHLLSYNDLAPSNGQCGFAARLLPNAEVAEGSQIQVVVSFSGEEIPGGNIVLQGYKYKVLGQFNLIGRSAAADFNVEGANTGVIRRTDFIVDFSTTAGNEDNALNIQLTHYLHGKPGTKWCSQFTKKFPPRTVDVLAFGWGNEEVDSKAVFTIGNFVEDSDGLCPSDITSITINAKGEISDEQKQRAQGDDWPYGQCKKDKLKPEWKDYDFTPDTVPCCEGSMLLTTVRKITYSLTHSKLPSYLEEILRWLEERYRTEYAPYFSLVSGGQLAEPGTSEVVLQYSAYKPTVDMIVKTPQRHYQYLEVPTGLQGPADYNPALDNTHYSRFFLLLQNFGISKQCLVTSETVLTPDNATAIHKQTGEFVLAAGLTNNLNLFSVFTKSQGGKDPLVVKIVNDGVTLELSRDGATINGKSVSLEKGVQVPDDDPKYALRAWQTGKLVMIYSRRNAVFIYYKGSALDIEQPFTNSGRASGLCGNLNGDPTDD